MLLWKSAALLLILLLAKTVWAQQCQPKFLLPATLQDSVELTVFTAHQSSTLAEYSYSYISSLFNSQPSALVSIRGFDLNNYAEINFVLKTSIQSSSLFLQFQSTNMAWQRVSLSLILHSREDIFSQVNSITVVANSKTQVQSIKQTASAAESLIVVHFIVGIQAAYASNYQFAIDDLQLVSSEGKFSLQANTNTTFMVQTVYFDSLVKSFEYGFKQIAWETSNAGPQSRYIWMEMAPITYSLIGLSKFFFSGTSLSLELNFNPSNNLLSFKSSPQFSQIDIIFMSLGRLGDVVCSPCDNFISISGCLDQCSSLGYPSQLAKGGKTCRQCFSELNQTKDPNGQGCICSGGKVYFEGNCYEASRVPLKCPIEQVLIDGGCFFRNTSQVISCPLNSHSNSDKTACLCNEGYESYKQTCLQACPVYSSRTSYGLCACKYGYIMNSSHLCESICPENSVYNLGLDQCRCNSNYAMINGKCSQCPKGQIFDPSTSQCLAAFYNIAQEGTQLSLCKVNEVVVNGQCVCDSWSIKAGDRCVLCPSSSFKQGDACVDCPAYCSNCTSTTCKLCKKGFNLVSGNCNEICGDGRRFVVQCDDGNNVDGDGCSSVCKVQTGFLCSGGSPISTDVCQKVNPSVQSLTITIEEGYPIYTTSGIITNFIVNPPVPRSQGDLWKLFSSITFSPVEGRPYTVILSQSESDPASIRCFFDYHNTLPNLSYVVQFKLTDNIYGTTQLSWVYDTLSNSVTSAVRMDRYPSRDRLT